MTAPDAARLRELLAKATVLPWQWWSDDGSMVVLSGPDELADHVLASSACDSCYQRAKDAGDPMRQKCVEPNHADRALIVAAVNALGPLLDRLEAQEKVLDLVRETEAPGGHHRLRRLHEELEDAWIALERLEKTDGR